MYSLREKCVLFAMLTALLVFAVSLLVWHFCWVNGLLRLGDYAFYTALASMCGIFLAMVLSMADL